MANLVSIPSTLPGLLDALCYAIDGKKLITSLTNHTGCISHHIVPLVIYAIGGECTNIHTHMHADTADKSNFKKPGMACLQPVHASFKIICYIH